MSFFELIKNFSVPIYVALAIAAGFFGWAIVTIVTAKGDPIKLEKGNKILLWTIIGIVIFSVGFLLFVLGGKIIMGENFNENPLNPAVPQQDEIPPAPYQQAMPPVAQ